eukprot:scaffold122344_cov27-Tisochrysis_lutea.AAC.4
MVFIRVRAILAATSAQYTLWGRAWSRQLRLFDQKLVATWRSGTGLEPSAEALSSDSESIICGPVARRMPRTAGWGRAAQYTTE